MNKLAFILALLTAGTALGQSVAVPVGVQTAPIYLRNSLGFWIPYRPSADTDVARGTALSTAVAAMTSADSILLAPADYDLGNGTLYIPGVLMGAGQRASTITSTADKDVDGCIIQPGSNSVVSDLSILGPERDTTFQAPYGCNDATGDAAFTGAILRNVYTLADSDAIYVDHESACSVSIYDCDLNSLFDTIAVFDTSSDAPLYIDVYNTRLTVDGPSNTGALAIARAVSATGGRVRLFNCIAHAQDGNLGTGTISVGGLGNPVVEVYGGVVTSSGGAFTYDLRQLAGTIRVDASVAYDGTKTFGTITPAKAFGVTPGATGIALLDDTSASAARTTLDAQQLDATLTALAGTTIAANKLAYGSGSDAFSTIDFGSAARSFVNTKVMTIIVTPPGVVSSTGDGKAFVPIPAELNNAVLASAVAYTATPGTGGTTNVDVDRVRAGSAADMLSTNPQVDAAEYSSLTGTAAAVNGTNATVQTDDFLSVNIDGVNSTTPAQNISIKLTFTLP